MCVGFLRFLKIQKTWYVFSSTDLRLWTMVHHYTHNIYFTITSSQAYLSQFMYHVTTSATAGRGNGCTLVYLFSSITQKVRVDCHEIWEISRLWTREQLVFKWLESTSLSASRLWHCAMWHSGGMYSTECYPVITLLLLLLHPFYGPLDCDQNYPGEPVSER